MIINEYKSQASSLAEKLEHLGFGFVQQGSTVVSQNVPGLFVLARMLGERNLEVNYSLSGKWQRRYFKNQESVVRFVKRYLDLD